MARATKAKEEAQREMGRFRSVAGQVAGCLAVITVLAAAGVGAWPSTLEAGASSSSDLAVIAGGTTATTVPTSGESPALATKLEQPQDVAADASGNIVICDTSRSEVEVLAESSANPGYMLGSGASWAVGSDYVIAGDANRSPAAKTTGTPGASTGLDNPEGVAIDGSGNVLIADTGDDEVDVLAVSATNPGYVLGADATWTWGDLYVIAGIGKGIISPSPTSSGAAATSYGLDAPASVATDGAGNVLIADTGHGRVEALAVGSDRPGYATNSSSGWVQGDLYVVAGSGSDAPTIEGSEGLSTVLDQPRGVAVDASGNVVIADTDHLTVEVLAGSTAGSTYSLGGGAVWTPGDLYVIAGGGTSAPDALGTSADDADLAAPVGVATDAVGNLVVADRADDEVEILAVSSSDPGYFLGSGATWTPGDLYVLAGGGDQTPSASGTDGLLTLLEQTDGVAVAPSGGVAVADSGDSEIEFLARAPVPPVLGSATPGDGTVTLCWSAPASDGGSPVTGYDVLVFMGGSSTPQETLVVGADTTSSVVGDLTDGVSYSFEVDAFTAVGTSQPSSALVSTPVSSSGGAGTGSSGTGSPGSSTPGSSTPGSSTPGTSTPGTSTPGTSSSKTGKTKTGKSKSGKSKTRSSKSGKSKSGTPKSGTPKTGTPRTGSSGSASSGSIRSLRPRVILAEPFAPVKSGFATVSLRCDTQLCSGRLQLVAHKVVLVESHGPTRDVIETVLVSSVRFSIRGRAVVSLPVPVTADAIREITTVPHFRVVVVATFAVANGANTRYKLALVAA